MDSMPQERVGVDVIPIPSLARPGEPNSEASRDGHELGQPDDNPYSLLSWNQKRCIAILAGIAAMFSPLTSNIYLPCIPTLQQEYETSLQLMNATITAYLVMQGISPTLFTQLAEKLGRRPVYLLTFSIFVVSSTVLALQGSYAALLLMRTAQSVGASVSSSLGYAVVSDIAAPSEKGRAFRPVGLLVNLGPVLAPVIGGPICHQVGWRWVFWFLTIIGSVFLVCIVLLLPETNRKVVGNGSIAAHGLNKPVLHVLAPKATNFEVPQELQRLSIWKTLTAVAPNPLKSFKMILEKDTFFVLFATGTFHTMYTVCQTTLPTLFKDAYGFNETQIGLCFLAISIGVIFGSYLQTVVTDWNYEVTAKRVGWPTDRVGDSSSDFPFEKARARLAWLFLAAQCICALGYGWAVHYQVHPAVPLIFQFVQGLCGWIQTWHTLLTDIHTEASSTASATGTLVRCLFGAAGVAAMEPLMLALGIGQFFTLLAGLTFCFGMISIRTIEAMGMKWRLERVKVHI